jgi:peroxiredoxin
MVRTASTMLPLGTPAPDFNLPDTDGTMVTLDDFRGAKGMLVMFICNHCPFVKHVRRELALLGRDYQRALGIVAINSNDAVAFPDDSPEMMKQEEIDAGYVFPYLFDETQEVARAYHAACTPDFFLFDEQNRLVYRGQLDDSRPGNDVPVTGQDLRRAIDALLKGSPIPPEQKPSLGCNIKWKENDQA